MKSPVGRHLFCGSSEVTGSGHFVRKSRALSNCTAWEFPRVVSFLLFVLSSFFSSSSSSSSLSWLLLLLLLRSVFLLVSSWNDVIGARCSSSVAPIAIRHRKEAMEILPSRRYDRPRLIINRRPLPPSLRPSVPPSHRRSVLDYFVICGNVAGRSTLLVSSSTFKLTPINSVLIGSRGEKQRETERNREGERRRGGGRGEFIFDPPVKSNDVVDDEFFMIAFIGPALVPFSEVFFFCFLLTYLNKNKFHLLFHFILFQNLCFYVIPPVWCYYRKLVI